LSVEVVVHDIVDVAESQTGSLVWVRLGAVGNLFYPLRQGIQLLTGGLEKRILLGGRVIQFAVVQWGVVIVASLGAAVLDIRARRIPNALTLPLLGGGLAYALGTAGVAGLGDALGACLVLALPYVVLFVFAGGGAGDAKMMGAIGAWLGLEAGVVVLVAVAATGGIFGLLRILAHRERRSVLGGLYATLYVLLTGLCSGRAGWTLLKTQLSEEEKIEPTNGRTRLTIPYGPAIFIGVCIGALVVHLWNG